MTWGGSRAVKRALLESVCWGNSMVGPNPTITAIQTSLLVLSVACRTKNVPRIEIDDRDEILTSSQKIEQIQYRSSRRSLCGVHVALKLDEYWAWLDPAAIYTDFKKKTRVNYSRPCRPANKQRAWRKHEVVRRETQPQRCGAVLAQCPAKSRRSTRPSLNPRKQ